MFTGLIEEVGKIAEVRPSRGARLLRVQAQDVLSDLKVDDSIAVNGVCLTVIARSEKDFSVEAVEETLKKSTLGGLRVGDRVNLERALSVQSRLGGHFVQGHVDGVAEVESLTPQAGGKLLTLRLPEHLLTYMIPKGSIAVDGVSLTIAELEPPRVRIALIPHTLEQTTLGELQPGNRVNIEADMLGKYIVQLVQPYLENREDSLRRRFKAKLED